MIKGVDFFTRENSQKVPKSAALPGIAGVGPAKTYAPYGEEIALITIYRP